MEVDKQLKFKSHERMQLEFISNNVDVMAHDCLSSVALALRTHPGFFSGKHLCSDLIKNEQRSVFVVI